jgi:hypothetical protein
LDFKKFNILYTEQSYMFRLDRKANSESDVVQFVPLVTLGDSVHCMGLATVQQKFE